jgi:hypothetical protein
LCYSPERRSQVAEFKWFYQGVKFQNGSETKELDLHSRYSCPQTVISSRELLSALSFYSLLPPPSQDMPYEVHDDINVNLYLDYHVKSKNSEHDGDDEVVLASQNSFLSPYLRTCDSDHMILHYELELANHLRKYSGNEVTFKFYWGWMQDHESRRPFELKSCGVYLHFDENLRADKKFKRKFWEI